MELAVNDDLYRIDLSDWENLTPAQQNAMVWLLTRRAHTARNRAIRQFLLDIAGPATRTMIAYCLPSWVAFSTRSKRSSDRIASAN
jgi:hypothetical protein